MLRNRGSQMIINRQSNEFNQKGDYASNVKDLEEMKNEESKRKMITYIKENKERNRMTEIDDILMKYLDEKLKEEIEK